MSIDIFILIISFFDREIKKATEAAFFHPPYFFPKYITPPPCTALLPPCSDPLTDPERFLYTHLSLFDVTIAKNPSLLLRWIWAWTVSWPSITRCWWPAGRYWKRPLRKLNLDKVLAGHQPPNVRFTFNDRCTYHITENREAHIAPRSIVSILLYECISFVHFKWILLSFSLKKRGYKRLIRYIRGSSKSSHWWCTNNWQ